MRFCLRLSLIFVLPSRVVAFYRAQLTRIIRLLGYLLLTLVLSLALLLSFEQLVWASENVTALSSPYVHRLWRNNKRFPATLTPWKEVDLVYERMFPYDRAKQPHPPAGCVVLPAISHHIDKQGTERTVLPAVLMLQCRENIDLLRPARWVSNRLHQQKQQGYLWLSIPEMGLMDVQVHMVAVKSSSFNPEGLDVKSTSSRPVIGLFIRHTMNVKQYTFKDTLTGKLDWINATPNHPFYVLNRHRYVPVSYLSTHDRLINVLGHPVALMCSRGKSSHCGQPYHPGRVITVYNLEVYRQHRYFVGEPGIMVHNGYDNKCRICGKNFDTPYTLNRHEIIHTGRKPHVCDVCGKGFTRMDILRNHIRNVHSGDRPYECQTCDKSFPRKDTLKKHYFSKTHIKNVALKKLDKPGAPDDASSLASGSSKRVEQQRARSRSPINPLGIDAPPSLFPELDSTLPALSSGESSLSWLRNGDF